MLGLLVAFFSFMVHLLLVLGTNRLCKTETQTADALLAAAMGALHAWLCTRSGFSFLGQTHWHLVILMLTAYTAFRRGSGLLRRGALFVLLQLVLGEMTTGRIWPVLLGAAVVFLLWDRMRNTQPPIPALAEVSITHGEKSVRLTALVDTGNTLTDPVSGSGVLVVEPNVAWQLLGLQPGELQDPLKTLTRYSGSGLRLIPYSSIGQPAGFLLGLRPREIWINGVRSRQVVAFSPHKIGEGKPFQALAGGIT